MIEVEIRGPLTEKEYRRLLGILKKKGKLLKEGEQTVIFFHMKRNALNLKKDHRQEKVVLKFGEWQEGSRKEVEVILGKGQFANALELFKGLGLTKGYRLPAFRQDFLYKGVQVSLKTKAVIGTHYEMETLAKGGGEEKKIKESLLEIARELGLKAWSDEEYRRIAHEKWEAHHPGPEDL